MTEKLRYSDPEKILLMIEHSVFQHEIYQQDDEPHKSIV